VFVGLVIPEGDSLDLSCVDLLFGFQNKYVAKSLPPEASQVTTHLRALLAYHVFGEIPVVPRVGASLTQLLRHVEDDCCGQTMKIAGELDQRLSRFRLHIGGVDHRELAGGEPRGEPLASNEVHYFKSFIRDALVVLIIRNKSPAVIRGQNFGRQEMP
jgi:hypothetical protein